MSDWKGCCLAVLVFFVNVTVAGAQDHQEKVKVAIATAEAGNGKWILKAVRSVDGDAHLAAIVDGALQTGSFPSDWRAREEFQIADGERWAWLRDRLEKRGVRSPLCTFRREPDGGEVIVVVGSVGPASSTAGIDLVITSSAVTTMEKLSLNGADEKIRTRLASETASHVADDPTSFSRLWENSTITLQPRSGLPPSGANSHAIDVLREKSLSLLAAICSVYSEDQRKGPGYDAINSALTGPLDELLGSSEDRSVPAELPSGRLLRVVITDVDPVMGVDVAIAAVELPANLGGVKSLDDFRDKYGGQKFGRHLLAEGEELTAALKQKLALHAAPSSSFPCFLSDSGRMTIRDQLIENPLVTNVGCERDPSSGRLVYGVTFRPDQSHVNVTVKADTVREISGQLGWNKTWARGESIALSAAIGTTTTSASASYSQPDRPWGKNANFKFRYDGSYVRETDVRLGNQSGPLIRRDETLIGPRAQIDVVTPDRQVPGLAGPAKRGRWYYSASLFAGFRDLTADASPLLPGPSPDRLTGAELTHAEAVEFENAPVNSDNGSTPLLLPARGRFSAGARLEVSECFPDARSAYSKGRLDVFVRQEFGSRGHTDYYFEGRGSAGLMSDSAPRLDFWRLGGADAVSGLDAGELAGRKMGSIAFEGGWNMSTLSDTLTKHAPHSSGTPASPDALAGERNPLDGLFLIGLAEYGMIGGQESAGALFSPHASASSFGGGVRLFGILPGPSRDSSMTLGYAWSPESIRKSGRIFVRVIIHL